MSQTINAAGIAIIKQYEGLVLVATPDPGGVLTIGYGHTSGVVANQTITAAQADQLLAQDLAIFEAGVNSLVTNPNTTSNQFSAMVSLAYNIGLGSPGTSSKSATGFTSSTVLKDHNAGNFAGAQAAFALWDKATVDGQLVVEPGLVTRRAAEAALYAMPDSTVMATFPLETIMDAAGNVWTVTGTLKTAAMAATAAIMLAAASPPIPPQGNAVGPAVLPAQLGNFLHGQ